MVEYCLEGVCEAVFEKKGRKFTSLWFLQITTFIDFGMCVRILSKKDKINKREK